MYCLGDATIGEVRPKGCKTPEKGVKSSEKRTREKKTTLNFAGNYLVLNTTVSQRVLIIQVISYRLRWPHSN